MPQTGQTGRDALCTMHLHSVLLCIDYLKYIGDRVPTVEAIPRSEPPRACPRRQI